MNTYGVNFMPPDPVVTTEVKACRTCLKTDTKLYNLCHSQFLSVLNDLISVPAVNTKGLPLYACGVCLYIIKKFRKFKIKCHKALQSLHQLQTSNQLTTDHVKTLDVKNLSLDLVTTTPEVNSYIPVRSANFATNTFHINVDTDTKFEIDLDTPLALMVNYVNCEEVEIKKETPETVTNNIKIIILNHDEINDDLVTNDNDYFEDDCKDSDTEVKLEIDLDVTKEIKKVKKMHKKESKKAKKTKEVKKFNEGKTRRKRCVKRKVGTKENDEDLEEDTIAKKELEMETDQNLKNAKLFYNSHPTKKVTQSEINKRMKLLDKFSETYNVEVKFLDKEEQKVELEERKKYYKYMPYKCDLCYRGYSIEDAYTSHMAVHDPSTGDYECHVCKIRCKTSRDREKHINATHLKRFRCKQCGVVTKSQSYAKAHYARHTGSSYACETCGKRFTQQTNYLSHMRTAHSDRACYCPLCYDAFLGPLGLKVHIGIMHRQIAGKIQDVRQKQQKQNRQQAGGQKLKPHNQAVECGCCGSHFENQRALDRHREDGPCAAGVRPCPACGINFASEKPLRKHYDDEHKTELKCDQCDKTFSTKFKLSKHVQEHLKSADDVTERAGGFVCESCGRANFKNLNQLRSHQRVHTGERPYQCPICPKTFRINTLLKSHMTIHTDERRYKCPLCPKAFHQSAHRTAHLLTHTKARPHQCPLCPKRYTSASAAREHADTVHRGLPARARDKPRGRER